ncbi:MAG TPA: phosphatase PAP2 family protein [Candidatus Cloacimonadota bacterium]|nr:phosphatase PAP2 family protein [Candidatus Cloacimonadota bacterium]
MTFYARVIISLYALWIWLFAKVGFFASRLSPVDLTCRLDAGIPFLPQSIWIYFFCYIYPGAVYLLATDWHIVNQTLLSIALASLTGFNIHLLYPTNFAKPRLGTSFSERVLGIIHRKDFPPGALKFPSLHVAIAWLICFSLIRQPIAKAWKAASISTTLGIVLATLFTKQHILIDVLGGTGLAFAIRKGISDFYSQNVDTQMQPQDALKLSLRKLTPIYLLLLASVLAIMLIRKWGNERNPYH